MEKWVIYQYALQKKRLFGARARIEIAHKSWPPINFADTSLGKDIERQLLFCGYYIFAPNVCGNVALAFP